MSLPQIDETKNELKLFNLEGCQANFAPWKRSERGQQVYVKLVRDDEESFLFVGENCILDAKLQQALIRLVNDGWNVAGELTCSFEGTNEPGIDPYVYQDPVTLELGKNLLPLLDPQQEAPLVQAMPKIRDEIAKESGLVPAGVRIKDNLRLGSSQYEILLHNSPIAQGEIFLDRFLAIGSFEQLSELEGWAAIEPTYRMKAKWIEANFREKAEKLGCILVGPLQVLLTHLKNIMLEAAPELLGLQDTFNLLSRLQITHPIVVNEFLQDNKKLRIVRRVLQELLSERVALNNLVTIVETIGDSLDDSSGISPVASDIAENCRLALARQICWSNLNPANELQAVVTGDKIDADLETLQRKLQENTRYDQASEDLSNKIVARVKECLQSAGNPSVIITSPHLRRFLSRLIAIDIPHMCVLSTSEAARSRVKLIINGTVEYKKEPDSTATEQHKVEDKADAHHSEEGNSEEAAPQESETSEEVKPAAQESSEEGGLLGIFKKVGKKKQS